MPDNGTRMPAIGRTPVLSWIVIGSFMLALAVPIWWLPRRAAERQWQNEIGAGSALQTLAHAEALFIDPDGNGAKGFWVGDVSGLYRHLNPNGASIRLIDVVLAEADSRPLSGRALSPPSVAMPKPREGYYFVAVAKYESEGKEISYDEGSHLNREAFGFAAFPSDYPSSGRRTFIIDRRNEVWWRDTGGKPPDVFPDQPTRAGWSR